MPGAGSFAAAKYIANVAPKLTAPVPRQPGANLSFRQCGRRIGQDHMRRISITSAALPPISTSAWRARPPVSSVDRRCLAPNNISWAPRGSGSTTDIDAEAPGRLRRHQVQDRARLQRHERTARHGARRVDIDGATGFPACWSRIRTGSKAARRCCFRRRSNAARCCPMCRRWPNWEPGRGQGDPARHR